MILLFYEQDLSPLEDGRFYQRAVSADFGTISDQRRDWEDCLASMSAGLTPPTSCISQLPAGEKPARLRTQASPHTSGVMEAALEHGAADISAKISPAEQSSHQGHEPEEQSCSSAQPLSSRGLASESVVVERVPRKRATDCHTDLCNPRRSPSPLTWLGGANGE